MTSAGKHSYKMPCYGKYPQVYQSSLLVWETCKHNAKIVNRLFLEKFKRSWERDYNKNMNELFELDADGMHNEKKKHTQCNIFRQCFFLKINSSRLITW